MKWVIKAVVLAGILVAAYFLLRTRILWLDDFEGTILNRVERAVPTVVDHHAREISNYYFEIQTDDDGRELTVKVDQLMYFRAREGMRVFKDPFSSEIRLVE